MILTLHSGAQPGAAAPVLVATINGIKTILQAKAAVDLKVIEWGINFSGFAAAAPPVIELLDTYTAAATMTTGTAEADVGKIGSLAGLAADYLTLGTTATGFNSGGTENSGTITNWHLKDGPKQLPPSGSYEKMFSLGQEPVLWKGNVLRIRVTAVAIYSVHAWMKLAPN